MERRRILVARAKEFQDETNRIAESARSAASSLAKRTIIIGLFHVSIISKRETEKEREREGKRGIHQDPPLPFSVFN